MFSELSDKSLQQCVALHIIVDYYLEGNPYTVHAL